MHERTRNVALVAPLLLTNSIAIWGQAAWAREHLTNHWVVALGFALALESISVFLAVESHAALTAGDSSFRLRMSSYGMAFLAGGLNYSHFLPKGTATALAFGVLSTVSPFLWGIRSRSINRTLLRDMGLIEPRSVKFSGARWLLYPSRTFRVFRAAVWEGVTDPLKAIRLAEPETEPDARPLGEVRFIPNPPRPRTRRSRTT